MSDKLPEPAIWRQATRRDITQQMNRALETADVTAICQAIAQAIRLHNVTDIAKIAGIERPSVYRALSGRQSPNFPTVPVVLKAMGLQLKETTLRRIRG